ncbi:MAG TPA: hypothetical protein VNB06_05515 [Thermoanaerobaculia bacterium]|nr:hypothetical protein [Thermoanaerobaculia bacterium]
MSGQATISGTLPVEHRLSRLRLGAARLDLGAVVVEVRHEKVVLTIDVGVTGVTIDVVLDGDAERRLLALLAGRADVDLFAVATEAKR